MIPRGAIHSTAGASARLMLRPPPITVAIATYRCTAYLRRAVQSILNQTVGNLTLVVVNDGDPEPPWPALADIADPRLVRVDLPENRGMYFALAAVLNATAVPYFAVQDADDWSEPERLAQLLGALEREQAIAATSAHTHHLPSGPQLHPGPNPNDSLPTNELRWAFFHQALFRSDPLRAIGGYYGGFRKGYDRVVGSLIRLAGKVAYVAQPLYHRLYRPDSLSNRRLEGAEAQQWRADDAAQRALYHAACTQYSQYRAGACSRDAWLEALRTFIGSGITPDAAMALETATARIRVAMTAAPAEQQARRAWFRLPPPAPEPLPYVSCAMPTNNRRRFIPGALAGFFAQSYPACELIINDDGADSIADLVPADPRVRYVRHTSRTPLGVKRNQCADLARGAYIVQCDDDDWQAPWRVAYQVNLLEQSGAHYCGTRRILHYEPVADRAWLFGVPLLLPGFFTGCCIAYRRELWEHHPFEPVTGDEDLRFARAIRREAGVLALKPYLVAMIHSANVSPKARRGAYWHPQPVTAVRALLGADLARYVCR
jgi:glycosyltransferase involved in cell wall biosynthesis